MDTATAISTASTIITQAAERYRDLKMPTYTAKLHSAAVGLAMAKVIEKGFEPTPANMKDLFAALYNQSAWRQKFEKAKLFAKADDKDSVDTLLADLQEEGVGE